MATHALDKFFDLIKYENRLPFEETEVEKIVVHRLDSIWDIHIKNKKPIDILSLDELRTICKKGCAAEGRTKRVYCADCDSDSGDCADHSGYMQRRSG